MVCPGNMCMDTVHKGDNDDDDDDDNNNNNNNNNTLLCDVSPLLVISGANIEFRPTRSIKEHQKPIRYLILY